MKKNVYKILSKIIPGFEILNRPKYTNFGGVQDYSKIIDFAQKHPDVQIVEKLKNKLLSE